MADYNATDTGSKIELTPINGRVADGIRLSDALSLQQIMAAQTLLPSNVAAASAVKMVDISADVEAHLTSVVGQFSVVSAKRMGNLVNIALLCTAESMAEGAIGAEYILTKYRPFGNTAYSYSIASNVIMASFLRSKSSQLQTSGVKAMYHNFSSGTVNFEFTYLTDDF